MMLWNNLELPASYYQDDAVYIIHGDCREVLPLIPDKSIDLVLTDPPYGIDYNPARFSSGGKWQIWHTEKITGDNEPFEPSLLLNYNHIILWGANAYSNKLPMNYGWLVWNKQIPEGMIASHCELAWTNFLTRVFIFNHLWNGLCRGSEVGKHLHPTQKPVVLMKWCLQLADCKGIMLDPYCGSGSSLKAAKDLDVPAIGIEIEEKYCEIAAKRCSQSVMRLDI